MQAKAEAAAQARQAAFTTMNPNWRQQLEDFNKRTAWRHKPQEGVGAE
jgi:hypothetical protein